jgi:hypothetical protein
MNGENKKIATKAVNKERVAGRSAANEGTTDRNWCE